VFGVGNDIIEYFMSFIELFSLLQWRRRLLPGGHETDKIGIYE
jgi:hypothetical protein